MNITVSDNTDLVERFHKEKLIQFLPVIVCMICVSIFGVVGNAISIVFYGFRTKRTPTAVLIIALAATDLVVCVNLVHSITEMGVNVYYTNPVTCKMFHFIGHWSISSSAYVLWVISIDRYRRICQSQKSQLDIRMTNKIILYIILWSLLMSVRDFVNFDIIEFPLETDGNLTTIPVVHYCTTTDDPRLTISVTVFHSIDALMCVTILGTFVVMYGSIAWTIFKSGQASVYVFSTDADRPESNSGTLEEDTEPNEGISVTDMNMNTSVQEESATTHRSVDISNTRENGNNTLTLRQNKSLRRSEKDITILAFVISIGFLLCFVPYFIIKIGIRSIMKASELELGAGIQFGLNLVYVNSFLNPFIFCMFNPRYRRFIRRLFSKCTTKSESSVNSRSQSATVEENSSS